MKLTVAWIGKTKEAPIRALTAEYVKRIARYAPIQTLELGGDAALLKHVEKAAGRVAPVLVLLDPQGRVMSSEQLAELLREHQQRGTQVLLFAVGGADGFGPEAGAAAAMKLSLGPMTLSHELARVVLLEQLYRGFTILAGHPYHRG